MYTIYRSELFIEAAYKCSMQNILFSVKSIHIHAYIYIYSQ